MGVRILTQEMERIWTDTLHFLFSAPIKREGVVRVGQCPDFRFPRLTPPRIRGILSFREVTLL